MTARLDTVDPRATAPTAAVVVAANNIVPAPGLRASAQLESQVLSRINDSKFAGILTPQFKEVLASKIRGDNRAEDVLGSKVEPEKMNQMLDELEKLKAKGLKDEHIQAIFIAGFVNGDMKGGGGVSGVLHFLNNTENAKYLKADGFDDMKGLLESKCTRAIRYLTEYKGLFRVDIPTALDRIYGRPGVLNDWLKKIAQEDKPSLLNRTLTPEEEEHARNNSGFVSGLDVGRKQRGEDSKTNPFFRKGGRCDDFAFHDAESRGINRFHFTKITSGVQGTQVSEKSLAGLLDVARVGTIIHLSKTGYAGENANSAQGSHWAVYLGGGIIQDQHGTWNISEFVSQYGYGKLEAAYVHPQM
jgi:hypothetical protein